MREEELLNERCEVRVRDQSWGTLDRKAVADIGIHNQKAPGAGSGRTS